VANDERENVGWRQVFRTAGRLLVFRATREELIGLRWQHFLLGAICTWLVGMGRYWDNPRVGNLQHLGVGSVVYIFALSLFLWLLVWPLRPQHWSYGRILTFVSLVSPPAIIYAIPVEKFFDLVTANEINAWFLAIVAAWRVALLIFFLRRLAGLRAFSLAVVTLLPLVVITFTLMSLNLEKVVLDIMGGRHAVSPNDEAYVVVSVLGLLSMLLFAPVVVSYLALVINYQVYERLVKKRKDRE